MARGCLPLVFLLTCVAALSLGASARAQDPAIPPTPPPPPIYAPPPPIYAPPPYQVMVPYDNQLYATRGRRYRRPYRAFAWRALVEPGGTLEGRVVTSVDGRVLRSKDAVYGARDLQGAFDLRLGVQRLFAEWFGLGLQLGYTNWQSNYLAALSHPRSHYLSLAIVPELRLKLGDSCRHCFYLLAGLRLGALLSVTGAYRNAGWNYARPELGGGGLWGALVGIEVRAAERLSLRLIGQYEGALLQNDVDYGRLGSERLSFRIDRPVVLLSFAVGIL